MDHRTLPVLLAGALLATAGCKLTAVEGNRDTRDAARTEGKSPPGTAKHLPLGAAGGVSGPSGDRGTAAGDLDRDQVTVKDRWRIGFPSWERGSKSDSPYDKGAWWDPYHQNLLKGDYALPGTQNTFLVVEGLATVLAEAQQSPTPSGVFPVGGGGKDFFRHGRFKVFDERLNLSLDLFHGETSFKPVDWRFFLRGVFDENQVAASENNALFADPSRGTRRRDSHAALQEAFFETTIASVSPDYDVVQARVGIQRFNADFKGFLLLDDALGARVFGTLDDNRWQWNAAYLSLRDKDTNSGLNELEGKKANVILLNLYRQDLLASLTEPGTERNWNHGLTGEVVWAHYFDDDSVAYDSNGFLVRPRPVGTIRPNHRTVDYFGFNLDGHIHRVNVVGSLYHAGGRASFDEIAGRGQRISADMAALELSIDKDWMRWKTFFLWQSGDDDPQDGLAKGYDGIHDAPAFAGGEFGFWNRNAVRLSGTGVGLVQRFSLFNSLRSSKDEGRPSYVNPGLILVGAGWDGQVTQQLKLVANASYLQFANTSSLEYVLNQDSINKSIGVDLSIGFIWRPMLVENVIVKGGVACLLTGPGYEDIYDSRVPSTAFLEVILRW